MQRFRAKSLKLLVILLFLRSSAFGYSVLTHEAIIDANWSQVIVPLLKEWFPAANFEDIKKAHAFAYGGSVMPDMGYYPSGSKLFTNLVHYVRSGDFITHLFVDAKDINEFAFALGVLSHYYGDNEGHQTGINLSVPELYPKMKRKFGDTVTYADDKISHLRTEFSFDVLQTGRGNYAPTAYHDFIGFQLSKDLVQKAFRETYGLDINEVFGDFDKAVARFRWSVKNLIPFFTKIAWKTKKKEIMKCNPSATRRSYIYRIRRHRYFNEFGNDKDKVGAGASLLSFFIRIIPKVGPLRILKFKTPTSEAEKIFAQSFDLTVLNYTSALNKIAHADYKFVNTDWDTGKKTAHCEYPLADQTYSAWVLKLKEKNFETITASAKRNILDFYKNYSNDPAISIGKWHETSAALKELKTEF